MVIGLGTSCDVPTVERTLHRTLRLQAEQRPGAVAVLSGKDSLSYDELYSRSRRLAGGFGELGVARGTPVLLMLDNHLEFVLSWFGVNLAGGIQVPVNTAYLDGLLAHVIHDSGAELIVIEQRYLDRLAQVWDRAHRIKHVVVRGTGQQAPAGPWGEAIWLSELRQSAAITPVEVGAWEPMGYLYTSGTTGASKGVITSHAQAFTYSITQWIDEDDRIMVNLPLFHIGGQWVGVYAALILGASAVIMPQFHASTFWQDAAAYECTQTLLIGAMGSYLLKQPPAETDRGHTMRHISMAPVIPEIDEFSRRFDVEVGSAYGLTEATTPLATPYGQAKPGLAGRLRPLLEARIVDEHDIEVETGSVGELVLRPREPWITMAGYLGRPRETSEAWINQWLHTGDQMYTDENGLYYFVDRKKDAIRVKGENVSSYEVESVIDQHPAVVESACVAVASSATEDEIRAFVAVQDGAKIAPEEILDFLVARLPYFMIPRFVDLVSRLPKTHTSRAKKDELRRRPLSESWDRASVGYKVTRDGRV